MSPRRSELRAGRRLRSAAVCCSLLLAGTAVVGACSSGSGSERSSTTSTTAAIVINPPLPVDVNQIPYLYADRIALGDWQFTIEDLTDPVELPGQSAGEDQRFVGLDVTIRNGALRPQTMKPEAFWMYDTDGYGTQPLPAAAPDSFRRSLPSGSTTQGRLVFAVPNDAKPAVLLFRGSELYGEKVLNGLVALDPDWRPDTEGL